MHRLRTIVNRLALCAIPLLGGLSCNVGLVDEPGGGGGVDLGSGGGSACAAGCPAPQICSKAQGVGCIMPGTCGGDADCEKGKMCAAPDGGAGAKTCVVGGKCGGSKIAAAAVPPNLLVVLDRSCSMTGKVGGLTKWEIAVDALRKMTTTYRDQIRFGMTLFPDKTGSSCGQDQIPIPVAPGNEPKIQTLLMKSLTNTDQYYPDNPCVTNIDTAMKQASAEPSFNDTMRKSYALLLTDGQQSSCNEAGGDQGTTTIITDLWNKRKIGTFVVGFGSGVDPNQLNIFAKAGGVPATGATSFYKAEDAASLSMALQNIASQALGCTYQLAMTPPNPAELYVFFDKTTRVPRDPNHMNGWDYDAAKKQVTFYGQACADLRNGKVKVLDIVYGCDAPPLE